MNLPCECAESINIGLTQFPLHIQTFSILLLISTVLSSVPFKCMSSFRVAEKLSVVTLLSPPSFSSSSLVRFLLLFHLLTKHGTHVYIWGCVFCGCLYL